MFSMENIRTGDFMWPWYLINWEAVDLSPLEISKVKCKIY